MTESHKKPLNKRRMWNILLAAAAILLAGLGADLFWQRETLGLKPEEKGVFALEAAETDGFVKTEDGWELRADTGSLTVERNGQFTGRLSLSYSYAERMDIRWFVWLHGESKPFEIEDHNSALIKTTVERLDARVDRIQIVWDREEMTPKDGKDEEADQEEETLPLVVTGLSCVNGYEMNWHRIVFVWLVLSLTAFLWRGRRWIASHLAEGYLIAVLHLGILMIVLAPANKVSWDEEVHFFHAYCVSWFGTEVKTNDILEKLFVADKENYPYNLPANRDERFQMNEELNRRMNEDAFVYSRGHALAGIYTPAYIPQAVGLRLGYLLHLPFTMVYEMGRLFQLLFCASVLAWAIHVIPVGKGILAGIGLLPTPVFLMSTYSYDAFLFCLFALGFAWFLKEYMNPEKPVEWPGFLVLVFSFAVGSMPKAIYIPLILVVLLLPQKKFKERRQEAAMKGLAVCLFLVLMASFVLPTALSPAETNDLRGGNTSEAGQIPYILSDIPRFLRMLILSVGRTFPAYTLGAEVFGGMGHVGLEMMRTAIPVLVFFLIFTDEKKSGRAQRAGLNAPARAWILLLCAGVIGMVWLAMYLAFTPVGYDQINGVQARYYIPLLLPLYLCLCPDQVKLRMDRNVLYPFALTAGAAVTLAAVVQTLLTRCG